MKTISFKQILSISIFAGLFAGLVLTAVQMIQVVPIILEAETYEAAGEVAPAHEHESAQPAAHEHAVWAPEDGLERTLYTSFANVTIGLGFALLLVALLALRGTKLSLGKGMLWGAAGYLVFYIAPTLGLPPEIPGTEAAPLANRQGWWLLAVCGAAAGLALIVYGRHIMLKLAGVLLMLAPHFLGAPMPEMHGSLAPETLAHQFISATAIANAAFWLALGLASAFFYRKTIQ